MRSEIRLFFIVLTILLALATGLFYLSQALGIWPPGSNTQTPPPEITIANDSLETVSPTDATMPENWSTNAWGTNTHTFTYLTNEGRTGSRAVKVEITKYTDGDAKWFFNEVPVTPGGMYRFTDWYKSNVATSIIVQFTTADATQTYIELGIAEPTPEWKQFTNIFQIPRDAKSMTVYHLINTVGWLITDDFAITPFVEIPLQRPIISLTFDDGWEHNVLTALPIMEKYGFDSTQFYASMYLEQSPQTGQVGTAGPPSVMAFYEAGHEIGSHSVTHPDLTTLTPEQMEHEAAHSKQYLESIVGVGNIRNFASPFGATNPAVLTTLRTHYESHRSTMAGFNTIGNFNPYNIRVQNMLNTTTLEEVQSWVDQAVKDKSWLVLVYHRVAPNAGQYDTPQADFEPQMQIIKNSGATVLTMEKALDEVASQVNQ